MDNALAERIKVSPSEEGSVAHRVNDGPEPGLPVVVVDELHNPLISNFEGEPDDAATRAELRWDFIRDDMKKKETQFIGHRDYRVWVGTWNVNGQEVVESLAPWLHVAGDEKPDMIFVGLQEMDRSAEAYVVPVSGREAVWNALLMQALQDEEERYVLVTSKSLVGIYASMFIREELRDRIEYAVTASAACGLMGMMGNKGAVGIRVKVDSDCLCFVSSHLAPHVLNVARRNQDYADLCRRLVFSTAGVRAKSATASEEMMKSWNDTSPKATIWDCGTLIWCGDLNYRIALPAVETRNLALAGQYEALLDADQLAGEMRHGRAFAEFEEAPITFAPTYKYAIGTDAFDSRPEGRPPAWPDRILYRRTDPVVVLAYEAMAAMRSSDHKPVRCLLHTKARLIDPAGFDAALTETLHRLDQYENEAKPVTAVSTNLLDYGELVYRRPMMMCLEILNTGPVPARFTFVPPPGRTTISAPYIHVHPHHGMISPGSSAEVRIYASVEGSAAQAMNAGLAAFEDILIVHVDGGSDHFISIEGEFRRTSFCRSLDELYEPKTITSLPDPTSGHLVPFEGIPKPVSRLVDVLVRHGLKTENLFLESGQAESIRVIQDSLDLEQPLPKEICESDIGQFSIAETLLRFLDSLSQPVIPQGLFSQCVANFQNHVAAKDIVDGLPAAHRVLFYYLVHFFRDLLLPNNKSLHAQDVAAVLANVLLRQPGHDGPATNRPGEKQGYKKTKFIQMFLEK